MKKIIKYNIVLILIVFVGLIFSVRNEFYTTYFLSFFLDDIKVYKLQKIESQLEIVNEKKDDDLINITSSEFGSQSEFPSKFIINKFNYSIKRGLNLIYYSHDDMKFIPYDVYDNIEITKHLVEKINILKNNRTPFLIISHDSLNSSWNNYKEIIVKSGLPVLASLSGRIGYIGYFDGKTIKEFSHPKTISLQIPISIFWKKWRLPSPLPLRMYLDDNKRFIAHAGGKIGEDVYTDSLDALNESYKNGLRLFELDIIKTSDGKYVAAHDWEFWKKITDYSGTLPPTHSVFMNSKILKKYEPLDIDKINTWFKENSDAILVTDKINDPIDFSNKFIDKNRLMMELFTIEALMDGIKAQILAPIISQDIWNEVYTNHYHLIKDKKLKYAAVSRNISRFQLRQMLENEIMLYAYHINFDIIANEEWVTCNERNLFYGMYIDDSKFFKLTSCKSDYK